MGFDWQSFATGFMESRLKDIEKKEDEARAFEQRQKELAERNAQTISKRRAVAAQVTSLTNMLRDNGASDRIIQAAIAAGPKEITTLANKVAEARKATGGKLSESDIEALVNVPEGFSAIDMDTEQLIEQTYGLGYDKAGVSEAMPKRTFMERLRGDKLMDRARSRLDSEVIQDGLTAYDINQIAAREDYESLVPGTFITFNDIQVFNPAKDMAGFTRTMNNLVSDVQDSSEYKRIDRELKSVEMNLTISDEEKASRTAELVKQRDALYIRTAGPTVEAMVKTYGESFLDATEGYLRGFMSDSYVDNLSFSFDEEEEQTSDAEVADITAEALGIVGDEPATATSITTPEVTVTELPPAAEAAEETPEELAPTDAAEEEAPAEKATTVQERAAEKLGISVDKFQDAMDRGVLTELDLQIFADHADDIAKFIEEGDYETTPEGISVGLMEWAQQTGNTLPFDKTFLVRTLSTALGG